MDIKSAQEQMCALASQCASLVGLGDHLDPESQRYLAIQITDLVKRELVQRGAIQPNYPSTIWEEGLQVDSLEQPAIDTLDPATVENDEAMTDLPEDDEEEDMETSENVDQTYMLGLAQEVFAVKLKECILKASNDKTRVVEPQFSATLPMVERLGPLMVKALTTYWDKELSQAEAALNATAEPRQALQTLGLAEYCRQPRTLAESESAGDFDGAVTSIKDIVQAQRDTTYARQGMKSWVWPLIEKYCVDTKYSKQVELGNEELLYMALGEKFPKGYGDYKLGQEDIESYGFVYQRPEKEATDKGYAASKFRGRRRNYYRCLSWLRTQGHSWLFMVNVKNLDSTFGKISDSEATLGPWIELFGSLPAQLSSRAFSRARGDYSGRHEMRFFKGLSQEARDGWHDFRVTWVSGFDLVVNRDLLTIAEKNLAEEVAFHSNTKYTRGMKRQPIEELANNEVTLKYGYRGFRNDNYSWSITIRDDTDGNPRASSTVPIKAGSFIGFLPGYCRFDPEKEEREEVTGFIESHWPGLFFEDEGCYGLLSFMRSTSLSAEGNVIGGWEQFSNDLGTDSMPWCIVVFAYRDIPALTPLVFWDHLRFD